MIIGVPTEIKNNDPVIKKQKTENSLVIERCNSLIAFLKLISWIIYLLVLSLKKIKLAKKSQNINPSNTITARKPNNIL